MQAFKFPLFVLLAVFSFLPLTVEARRPRGTEMSGVITQVDHASRSITFVEDASRTPRVIAYAARAKFWHAGPDASPTALKAGMRVQIRLHRPLIGRDYVTQVRLLGGGTSANTHAR